MTDLFNGPETEQEKAKVECALVFVPPKGDALCLAGYGAGNDSDRECLGPDEIGPTAYAPKEFGLWLWSGIPLWVEERSEGVLEGCVPEWKGRGTWRRLNHDESLSFARFGGFPALDAPTEE